MFNLSVISWHALPAFHKDISFGIILFKCKLNHCLLRSLPFGDLSQSNSKMSLSGLVWYITVAVVYVIKVSGKFYKIISIFSKALKDNEKKLCYCIPFVFETKLLK